MRNNFISEALVFAYKSFNCYCRRTVLTTTRTERTENCGITSALSEYTQYACYNIWLADCDRVCLSDYSTMTSLRRCEDVKTNRKCIIGYVEALVLYRLLQLTHVEMPCRGDLIRDTRSSRSCQHLSISVQSVQLRSSNMWFCGKNTVAGNVAIYTETIVLFVYIYVPA